MPHTDLTEIDETNLAFDTKGMADSTVNKLKEFFDDSLHKTNSKEIEKKIREIIASAYKETPEEYRDKLYRELSRKLHADKLNITFNPRTVVWLTSRQLQNQFQDILIESKNPNDGEFLEEITTDFYSWVQKLKKESIQLLIFYSRIAKNREDNEAKENYLNQYNVVYKLFPPAAWLFSLLIASEGYPFPINKVINVLGSLGAIISLTPLLFVLPLWIIERVAYLYQVVAIKAINALTFNELEIQTENFREANLEEVFQELLREKKRDLDIRNATDDELYRIIINHQFNTGTFSEKRIERLKESIKQNLTQEAKNSISLPLILVLKYSFLGLLKRPPNWNSSSFSFKLLMIAAFPFRFLAGLAMMAVYTASRAIRTLTELGILLSGVSTATLVLLTFIILDIPIWVFKTIPIKLFSGLKQIYNNRNSILVALKNSLSPQRYPLIQSLTMAIAMTGFTFATFGLAPALLGIAAGVGFLSTMIASQPLFSGNRLLPKLLFGGLLILGAAATVALTIIGGGVPAIALALPFALPAAFAVKAAIVASASLILTSIVNSGLPKLVDVIFSSKDGKSKETMSDYNRQRDENLLIEGGMHAPRIRYAIKCNNAYLALFKTEKAGEKALQQYQETANPYLKYEIEEVQVVRPSSYSKLDKEMNKNTEHGRYINHINKSYKFYDQSKDAGFFKPVPKKEEYSEKLKTVYEYQRPMPSLS